MTETSKTTKSNIIILASASAFKYTTFQLSAEAADSKILFLHDKIDIRKPVSWDRVLKDFGLDR